MSQSRNKHNAVQHNTTQHKTHTVKQQQQQQPNSSQVIHGSNHFRNISHKIILLIKRFDQITFSFSCDTYR